MILIFSLVLSYYLVNTVWSDVVFMKTGKTPPSHEWRLARSQRRQAAFERWRESRDARAKMRTTRRANSKFVQYWHGTWNYAWERAAKRQQTRRDARQPHRDKKYADKIQAKQDGTYVGPLRRGWRKSRALLGQTADTHADTAQPDTDSTAGEQVAASQEPADTRAADATAATEQVGAAAPASVDAAPAATAGADPADSVTLATATGGDVVDAEVVDEEPAPASADRTPAASPASVTRTTAGSAAPASEAADGAAAPESAGSRGGTTASHPDKASPDQKGPVPMTTLPTEIANLETAATSLTSAENIMRTVAADDAQFQADLQKQGVHGDAVDGLSNAVDGFTNLGNCYARARTALAELQELRDAVPPELGSKEFLGS
ncbi:MAG: hypothetical protein J2P19_01820 [Pseudonocardia sp.]|nr:hypothetical protein [Pseudonocardia sp.]